MASTAVLVFLLATVLTVSVTNSATSHYTSAKIESCSGCSLNRLPDIQQFIFKDVPEYDNVEFVHIQGAAPMLVLYNNDEEVERLPLSRLTREECNDLLVSKGFTKTSKPKDEM